MASKVVLLSLLLVVLMVQNAYACRFQRKSVKTKDKKMQRKVEVARAKEQVAAAQTCVDAANAVKDPLEQLQPFKRFDRNGLSLSITCERVASLDPESVDWAFQLTKSNMKTLYEQSGWGWNDKQKHEEMTEEAAWYLIARDSNNKPVALSHFRFEVDEEEEVLYCYEIQLVKEVRRKGLGKFLMQILELMAHKMQMNKVMLTVFKDNAAGQDFFKGKLKYEIDETNPEATFVEAMFVDEIYTYEILSKPTLKKTKAAAATVPCEHNGHAVH